MNYRELLRLSVFSEGGVRKPVWDDLKVTTAIEIPEEATWLNHDFWSVCKCVNMVQIKAEGSTVKLFAADARL